MAAVGGAAMVPAQAAAQFSLALPASVISNLPEVPIFCAGAFGGPLVIGAWTPMRNACTVAAQDSRSGIGEVYSRVFSRGLLSGWTGAKAPAAAAALQFTTLGPGYHLCLSLLGNPVAALAGVATIETFMNYGPSTRNAQLMHNSVCGSEARVPLRPIRPVGPGASAFMIRNFVAASGIRILSDPLNDMASRLAPEPVKRSGVCKPVSDFFGSLCCGVISMPFNQLYNFQVTSAASLSAGPAERARLAPSFLRKQYMTTSASGMPMLSRIVLRDAFIRAGYVGVLFSSYAAVERVAVALWRA